MRQCTEISIIKSYFHIQIICNKPQKGWISVFGMYRSFLNDLVLSNFDIPLPYRSLEISY